MKGNWSPGPGSLVTSTKFFHGEVSRKREKVAMCSHGGVGASKAEQVVELSVDYRSWV